MYLWVNMTDLLRVGTIGAFGSVLNMMVRSELGDELLDGAVYKPGHAMDDVFIIVKCTEERAEAIAGGLEVIGERKLHRKVRTHTTQNPPGGAWQWVYIRTPRQLGNVRGVRLPRNTPMRTPIF